MSNQLLELGHSFVVIKIGDRYLAKITNKRISTAWSVLGAKKYWSHSDQNFLNDCYRLIAKKRKFYTADFGLYREGYLHQPVAIPAAILEIKK